MKKSAYGKPILIQDDKRLPLKKVSWDNELVIQQLIFEHPECLPISDIDESYNPAIPVCTELNTPVGPLDILMVTPNGELTIVETKLWRNPEARRVVIAQILDYAKELSNWSYSDLQREINRRLKRKGNTLYDIAKKTESHLVPEEADFVDSVSRNLSKGKFLLLIAGDGIREGAIGITEFLSNSGQLAFTLAMVELSLYRAEEFGTLILPKTIVKTVDIPKLTIELPTGLTITNNDDIEAKPIRTGHSEKWEKEKAFYTGFWKELVAELSFDDPGQPLPSPAKAQNLFVYPGKTKKAWISAYFHPSKSRVGVYFRTANDQEGWDIQNYLNEYESEIKEELNGHISGWDWDQFGNCFIYMECKNPFDPKNRAKLKEFFSANLNLYINVFRPRIKRFELNNEI